MPKLLFQMYSYFTHSWEDDEVHTFPKGICPKVNVIVRLEFELAYYDPAVHRFNHYTTRTPLHKPGYIYRTVKIHKPGSPFRPIISQVTTLT